MIALAHSPTPTAPRPLRSPRLAVEDTAVPASTPIPSEAAAVWPANDRLPLAKKVHILAERGLWSALDAVARTHGWHSVEVARFIDAQIPKRPCPICGTPFYVYSRRVQYCGDRCRRAASASTPPGQCRVSPTPKPPIVPPTPRPGAEDLCVCFDRRSQEAGGRRFYSILVVQDLFGSVALVRRWGRAEQGYTQQVVTNYATLDEALAQLETWKGRILSRGYHITAQARGSASARVRAAYRAAMEAGQ